jgi:hypothetical protein
MPCRTRLDAAYKRAGTGIKAEVGATRSETCRSAYVNYIWLAQAVISRAAQRTDQESAAERERRATTGSGHEWYAGNMRLERGQGSRYIQHFVNSK